MTKPMKAVVWAAVTVSLLVLLGFGMKYQIKKWYLEENPVIWLPEIWAFEAQDKQVDFPDDAVVFVGSSSIRFWDSLAEDMAPLAVIKRGFGGARLSDVIHYIDRIVVPYEPAAIVLFAGTNDMIPGRAKSPEAVLALYQSFVQRVLEDLPDTPIFYIAITPSPKRWAIWPQAQEANRLIKAHADLNSLLTVIDTKAVLMTEAGEPNASLYRDDGLHLNEHGYQAWTSVIRPVLLQWAAMAEAESDSRLEGE